MQSVIAVPSENPGGLEANLGNHFGHCDLYTLVTVENNEIVNISTVPNIDHQQGGCLAPVQMLAGKGISKLIAGGMGMRPLMGFNQAGIEVYFSNGALTVGQAIKSMLAGQLQQFKVENSCGGCHGH